MQEILKKIENLKLEELRELRKNINKKIEEKEQRVEKKLVLVTHPCKGSSNHHLIAHKHWMKAIDKVDTTKTNGYAFVGKFLNVRFEHKIEEGKMVALRCGNTITLCRVKEGEEDGLEEIEEISRFEMSGLIERAYRILNGLELEDDEEEEEIEEEDDDEENNFEPGM